MFRFYLIIRKYLVYVAYWMLTKELALYYYVLIMYE